MLVAVSPLVTLFMQFTGGQALKSQHVEACGQSENKPRELEPP